MIASSAWQPGLKPDEVVAFEKKWLAREAETLDRDTRDRVIAALREPAVTVGAVELFKLLRARKLPAEWKDHLDNLWGFSR